MKFPALLIFNDGTLKVLESTDEINGDIDWSCVNYEDDDFIIDCDLNIGKFTRSDDLDKVFAILSKSVIQHADCSKSDYRKIMSDLKINLGKYDESSKEASLGNKLVKKICDYVDK